ncbi:MAG: hydroxymethylglutaryl-CoA reductase [Saprospiraceae bacterium]|nr:hydroxymethylglutaryl-CoA reductase [Saprospiraceae bacterium]
MSGVHYSKSISGFSKLRKRDKIKWIVENFFKDPENVMHELMSYWHHSEEQQKILDGFSENTISNFPMPFSVAPNFFINGKTYCVPMVIEESSVVAAAASAAKYWMDRGGIQVKVLSTKKLGQIHFLWNGEEHLLRSWIPEIEKRMRADAKAILSNMEKRGGGLIGIELIRIPDLDQYYQWRISFETCDSMGANFINSCLESFSVSFENFMTKNDFLKDDQRDVEMIMSILSNYTPECIVRAWVSCPINELGQFAGGIGPSEFADRFEKAIKIARSDTYRAVTHNKGIFNGIDAVVIATANDFRAVEACGHAYAARDGVYRSLSDCSIQDGLFHFWLEIPLALGTIGGLTSIHPIAKRSLELLGNPSAEELMMITAATGLAQNFAAVRSLITTGIQAGHMKMHLTNILNHFGAKPNEEDLALEHFSNKKVSFSEVRKFLDDLRSEQK